MRTGKVRFYGDPIGNPKVRFYMNPIMRTNRRRYIIVYTFFLPIHRVDYELKVSFNPLGSYSPPLAVMLKNFPC